VTSRIWSLRSQRCPNVFGRARRSASRSARCAIVSARSVVEPNTVTEVPPRA